MFPDLFVGGRIVKKVGELKILGVVIYSQLSFESHVRSVAASASRRIGILRKTMSVFRDNSILSCCFWSFLPPVLEYCCPACMFAAVGHLLLLDRVVRSAFRLSGGVVSCDVWGWHRRRVATLPLFYHIRSSVGHSVGQLFPQLFTASLPTRYNILHPFTLVCPRSRTSQHSRTFIPACVS